MFETSLMESSSQLKTKSSRWMLATAAFNLSILAVFILIPFLYPDALPRMSLTALLVAPPPPPPPPTPPQPQKVVPVKIISQIDSGLRAPSMIPLKIRMIHDEAPPFTGSEVQGMQYAERSNGPAGANLFSNVSTNASVIPRVVPTVQTGPVKLPSRAVAALIISRPDPVYPAIAKAVYLQGAVILHAIISKEGTIENLSVISGNGMLVNAAQEAVQRWRYKPYLLNDKPVEVETSITVNFTFGGG